MSTAPSRVLITGVSRYLGGRLAALLTADPSIERVIGVDTVPPHGDLGRAEFVRADIRNPLIAKVIAEEQVDTVLHMNVVATPFGAGGRTAMKEINVIGTMQLLAACQKGPSVRKLIVKSTTAVYGSSSQDPGLFTEEMEPRSAPRSGFGKDAVEVEGYVRGFGRRRPDVALSVLRFTNFIGPTIDSLLTRYFSLPVVPTVLGFDPRLQLCHEDDGVEVLHRATVEEHPGTFNVGGDGVLLLSQAVRRCGKLALPIPSPAVAGVGQLLRRAGVVDVSPEQLRFLNHGRAVDTTKLAAAFGDPLRWSSRAALDDFVAGRPVHRTVDPATARRVERGAVDLVTRWRGAHA